MVNRPKAKGTAAESAIVKYAAANGFAGAMRPALGGASDHGDVWLEPGPTVIVESKNVNGPAALGAPPAAQLSTWITQTIVEAANAGADLGVLVVKRKGTTDVARWFAWVPGWLAVAVHTQGDLPSRAWPVLLDHWVCVPFESALLWLRGAGYGDALPSALTAHAVHRAGPDNGPKPRTGARAVLVEPGEPEKPPASPAEGL